MRKKRLKCLCCIDGIITVGFLSLAIYENGTDKTGTAALTSLGRWVMYAGGFVSSAAILAILIYLVIRETKRK